MRKRKWSIDQLRDAGKNSTSYRQVLQKLGLIEAGGNYAQIKKYLKEYSIDIKHFKGEAWNKGLKFKGKYCRPIEQIMIEDSDYQSFKLKNRLFDLGMKTCQCEECGWAKKSEDGRIPLELDHINGKKRDNRLENLRILCPNCHSLKPTHRGRNRRK